MSPASAPAARLPPAVWLFGWAAAVGLAVVAAVIAPFVSRAAVSAACCAAASLWAWRGLPAGSSRLWITSIPIAAWAMGTFGWDGAAVVSVAGYVLLLRTDRPARPDQHGARGSVAAAVSPTRKRGWGIPDPRLRVGLTEPLRPSGTRSRSAPGCFAEPPVLSEPEPVTADEEEDEPDQWFTRTATGSADVVSGELLIDCDAAGGTGHVLFWPAFAGAPRVACHPADGLGRVRAACVLPHGVRLEVVRRGEPGPVRVVYEATGPRR